MSALCCSTSLAFSFVLKTEIFLRRELNKLKKVSLSTEGDSCWQHNVWKTGRRTSTCLGLSAKLYFQSFHGLSPRVNLYINMQSTFPPRVTFLVGGDFHVRWQDVKSCLKLPKVFWPIRHAVLLPLSYQITLDSFLAWWSKHVLLWKHETASCFLSILNKVTASQMFPQGQRNSWKLGDHCLDFPL